MKSITPLCDMFHAGEYDAIIVAGQTASGKSALGIALAHALAGEVIGVDSRQVYKGMVIGTGSVLPEEQEGIPHHMVNTIGPETVMTAAAYQKMVYACMQDIVERQHVPILVGGTGMYIDGILFGYSFRAKPDTHIREELNALYDKDGLDGLFAYAKKHMPKLQVDHMTNPRHVIRAMETFGTGEEKESAPTSLPPWKFLVIVVEGPTDVLNKRIEERHARMFDDSPSLVDEIRELYAMGYSADHEGMTSLGYREARAVLEGTMSLDEAKAKTIQAAKQYAKRQRTWFRRLAKQYPVTPWVMYS